ncbi:MAG: tetratricopeptide repeat protein [Planctomycetota bacterium]
MAALFAVLTSGQAQTQEEAEGQPEIQLPRVLVEVGLELAPLGDQGERAGLSLKEALAAHEPAAWPESNALDPAAALPPGAAALIPDSASALEKGEAFRAVQLLRQAEEIAPDHPTIIRALGMASAESGNLTRAAAYLRRIIAFRQQDTEALLILTRHAAQSESLEQTLTYCQAIDKNDVQEGIADYYRATALARVGYTTAAAECLSRLLDRIDETDLDELADQGKVPALLLRELRVIQETIPQLRIQQGDLFLKAAAFDRAAKVYDAIKLDEVSSRHTLVARRVYLALRATNPDSAIDQAIALLREPDAGEADAELVGYLKQQGVSDLALAQRIEALVQTDGVTLARLIALSRVAEKGRLLGPINNWLSSRPVSPGRLRQAIALVPFDDAQPADAEALADLFKLVANLMQQSPKQAYAYAQAAVSEVQAPVTILRAIRSDRYAAQAGVFTQLLAAVAYEQTLRRQDALSTYLALSTDDAELIQQVRFPTVRLQLALGLGQEAFESLGTPDVDADWTEFELSIRAMAAAGQAREALALLDERIRSLGKQLRLDLLRIEMIAMLGRPQEACNLLLRLISSQPNDEALYRLGIDLAYDYRASFSRITDADRMRRAFVTRLISNLPDSAVARIGMARNIMGNPARFEEAEQQLFKVLEQEPENADALFLLVELYDSWGAEDMARAMFVRYIERLPLSVGRTLTVAERAVKQGQQQLVIQVIESTLQLEEQGVLPGPAMTGAQAASLLHYLEAANPERQTDDLFLAMIRRFPDDAGLNNALGYRWAVQGKNLLQAKAMIERALQADPGSHSIMDSLAWVQYKLGEFDEAKATQSRALMVLEALLARLRRPGLGLPDELVPDLGATTAILNDHMGDIHYKLGEERKAIDAWRVAMKQAYGEEEMQFDPELATLADRLNAKIDAIAEGQPVPVAEVPGPEAHGPAVHPAENEQE